MDEQSRNLILATVLSFAVILVWYVFVAPYLAPEQPATAILPPAATTGTTAAPAAPGQEVVAPATVAGTEPLATAAEAPRVAIDTQRLKGSISLRGGRIDDLSLKDYRENLESGSGIARLFSPAGTKDSFYALFGWNAKADGNAGTLPGPDTLWQQVGSGALGTGKPITLAWSNDTGLKFTRTIAIDDAYLFTVTDRVENTGATPASLYAFGVVERQGIPANSKNFFILHEGAIRMADGIFGWVKYSNFADLDPIEAEGGPAEVTEVASKGWIGITDHYWQAVLVPEAGAFTAVTKNIAIGDVFRTVARKPVITVAAGASSEVTTRLFAGPKEWEVINRYQDEAGVDLFIESIDWGWFFFLTKPIFRLLHWLNGMIGNMGWAIIALTFILKALVFPLARKSYVSMARMKELQPEMEALKARVGDDRAKMQQEMMALYRKNKVNPAAGCLPILIQIPIFFSLYKVIFVTIELRHAPWFGWIRDLSAPDPSSFINLFGLLPWASPVPGSLLGLIFIGILPILLGISMWLQQKLNPAPTDPTQQMIFAWMPWIFMFMLGGFASGLVVYWIANNLITVAQQYIIMSRHGHRPDLFGNILRSVRRKAAVTQAPAPEGKPAKPGPKSK